MIARRPGVTEPGTKCNNIRLFIPVRQEIKKFLATLENYPFQQGVTVGGEGVNYRTLGNQAVLKHLDERDLIPRPAN